MLFTQVFLLCIFVFCGALNVFPDLAGCVWPIEELMLWYVALSHKCTDNNKH